MCICLTNTTLLNCPFSLNVYICHSRQVSSSPHPPLTSGDSGTQKIQTLLSHTLYIISQCHLNKFVLIMSCTNSCLSIFPSPSLSPSSISPLSSLSLSPSFNLSLILFKSSTDIRPSSSISMYSNAWVCMYICIVQMCNM